MSDDASQPAAPAATDHGRLTPQIVLCVVLGVAFIAVLLVIAVVIPEPKPFQARVFRVVLGLAAAGVGAVIPGMLHVSPGTSGALRATGASGFFLLVYFVNPTGLVADPLSHAEVEAIEIAEALDRLQEAATTAAPAAGTDDRSPQITEEIQQKVQRLEELQATAPLRDRIKLAARTELAEAHTVLAERASDPARAQVHRDRALQEIEAVNQTLEAAPPERLDPDAVQPLREETLRLHERLTVPVPDASTGR